VSVDSSWLSLKKPQQISIYALWTFEDKIDLLLLPN
jgi:hypothetical protein